MIFGQHKMSMFSAIPKREKRLILNEIMEISVFSDLHSANLLNNSPWVDMSPY